jgi:tryptophanyl-tRNA synthetase
MKRILTGLKPSGELTLGSLIGCINQMVKLQDEYDSFMFVPDMHAITVKQDPKMLRERIRKNVALYLACGVDPDKNTIYLQSENLYHANLSWVLECTTYMGEASRMTQYKDKSSKGENVTVGLFTYPILMAADILLYDADYVPVGIDQKQHVELARDIALRFNKTYGDTFKMPEPMMSEVGVKIMDLQEPTKKMSKSDETYKGVILLLDDEKTIRKKIMSAVTDSDNKIYYDKDNKPGVSNLLTIYSSLKNISIEEAEDYFKDYNYGNFKKEVADLVVSVLSNIQTKYNEIINGTMLDDILDEGREKTCEIAKEKTLDVFRKVGLGRN